MLREKKISSTFFIGFDKPPPGKRKILKGLSEGKFFLERPSAGKKDPKRPLRGKKTVKRTSAGKKNLERLS